MPPTDNLDLRAIVETLNQSIKHLERKSNPRSRYPYYTEEAANMVLDAIAQCLTECKPVLWLAHDVSVMTLYNKFRQGARYVSEQIDPEFGDKLRLIQVNRLNKIGIKISPRTGMTMLLNPNLNWKKDFERYIDESQPGNPPFERINLPLSDDDKEYIHRTLYELKSLFMYELSPNRLLVIRIQSTTPHDLKGDPKPTDGGPRETNREGTDDTFGPVDPFGAGT